MSSGKSIKHPGGRMSLAPLRGSSGTEKGTVSIPRSINPGKSPHVTTSNSMPKTGNIAKVDRSGRG